MAEFSPDQSTSFAHDGGSGHRDSNSAGTAWKAGFSPREIPASGRPYSHRYKEQVLSGLPEPTFGIEPNPPRYQRGARPSCCMGRRTAAQLGRDATSVDLLGNAPRKPACRAGAPPSAQAQFGSTRATRSRMNYRQNAEESNLALRIRKSAWPPWPALYDASYEERTRLTPLSHHEALALPPRVERASRRVRSAGERTREIG